MTITRNLVEAYQVRQKSENWAEWEMKHPEASESLAWAASEWEKLNG